MNQRILAIFDLHTWFLFFLTTFVCRTIICQVEGQDNTTQRNDGNSTDDLFSTSSSSMKGRNKSYERIAGYEPVSSVSDHNLMDLDQAVMENELAKQTFLSLAIAQEIYEKGGHSRSYAILTLTGDDSGGHRSNTVDFVDGNMFTGVDNNFGMTFGKVYKSSLSIPDSQLWLQYKVSDSLIEGNQTCRVGGLTSITTTDALNIVGCFEPQGVVIAPSGNLYGYTYSVLDDNKNARTMQGLSLSIREEMIEGCPRCPYEDASYAVEYYGTPDYGDKWVMAALSGNFTGFEGGRGNADFRNVSLEGRAESVKRATVCLNLFMYIIKSMEVAIDDCQRDCWDCDEDGSHSWDEAVAFYTGSLEGQDGESEGKLLYQLADDLCEDFGTCIGSEVGKSNVNDSIFKLLKEGQSQFYSNQCIELEATKKSIVQKMYIPLVQGLLKSSFNRNILQVDDNGVEEAKGATYAASILPKVYGIRRTVARQIYIGMKIDQSFESSRFTDVKGAVESIYSDLGITCEDVGGLMVSPNEYFEGAGPCSESAAALMRRGWCGAVSIGFGMIIILFI